MKFFGFSVLGAAVLCAVPVLADVLELKSGDKVQGTFVGRSEEGVQFKVGSQTLV